MSAPHDRPKGRRFDPDRHHRRSIRLQGYDYAQAGAYFLTFCTHNRECLFGDIMDGRMRLNALGEIVADEWMKTAQIRAEIELDEWVIMPNHFHAIVVIIDNNHRRGDDDRSGNNDNHGTGDRPVAPTTMDNADRSGNDDNRRTGDRPVAPTTTDDDDRDSGGNDNHGTGDRPVAPTAMDNDNRSDGNDDNRRTGDRPVAPTTTDDDDRSGNNDNRRTGDRPVAPTAIDDDNHGGNNDDHGTGDRPVAPTAMDNDRDDGNNDNHGTGDRPAMRPMAAMRPTGPKPKTIGALMAGFKSAVTTRINQMRQTPGAPLWQRNYWEHIIRNDADLQRIREYIQNNPARWEMDKLHEDDRA